MLIFPEASSAALISAVAGGNISTDDLDLMEDEVLAETGNVVLNSCLGSMANMLERPLQLSLPQVLRGDGRALFAAVNPSDHIVLVVHINFLISEHDVRGYVAIVMDLLSLTALRHLVAEFVRRFVSDADHDHSAGSPA